MKNIYIKYKEIINYLVVGILTTIVSLGSYYICTNTFLNADNAIQLQAANVISWVFAVIFAYFTNRKYVFESKNPDVKKEFIKFVGSRITTLLMDMFVMFITVTLLEFDNRIAKLFSQVIVTIGNYVISKFFVFKKNK